MAGLPIAQTVEMEAGDQGLLLGWQQDPHDAELTFRGVVGDSRAQNSIRKRVEVVEPDWPLVAVAARIKAGGGLSYADAFCIATAIRVDAPSCWDEHLTLDLDIRVGRFDWAAYFRDPPFDEHASRATKP